MRAEFFDRMKVSGWDYARISRRLGPGFSGTTLSRIANGGTVPNRAKLSLILGLVEEIGHQPLTEQVREHVYEVYMRALAVAKPELHHAYLVEDETRRLLAEVEDRRRLGRMDGAAESGPPEEHLGLEGPVVLLRDEVLQHVQQVAQARIPLITQPPRRFELAPSEAAMLLELRHVLRLTGQSVTRHIALLETAEEESAPEATPTRAVLAAETVQSASPSGPGQKPPQSTTRTVVVIAVTAVVAVAVLLAGVLLDHALRPDTVSAGPSARSTEPATPGTNKAGKEEKSASPTRTSAGHGTSGTSASPRHTDPSRHDGASAPTGEAPGQSSGETPDRDIVQDGGASQPGTDSDNDGRVSPSTTASTESSPRHDWTLTIRISADSDGEVRVAHNDGQQTACGKTINEPAKECTYIIPDNNTVTLDPVDFVQSWGSGACEGADPSGGCLFFMTSDTEFTLHVLRESG
jgi:hypothetical protein